MDVFCSLKFVPSSIMVESGFPFFITMTESVPRALKPWLPYFYCLATLTGIEIEAVVPG